MPPTYGAMNTRIDPVAKAIFRISTPVPPNIIPGGFSFNQYLLVDESPLLFHTGPLKMFDGIRQAVASVIPVEKLRYISFSHTESDECGSLREWLGAAPKAVPLCGSIAAMVSVGDMTDRPVRAMKDGEELSLGRFRVKWLDTPHMPHGWDCGFLMETTTGTLLCGDLFTQGGDTLPPVTEEDILQTSEAFRRQMDYFSHGKDGRCHLEKLAKENPRLLACMHGSAWKGDGARLLRKLADALET